jgi:hypothetical protein
MESGAWVDREFDYSVDKSLARPRIVDHPHSDGIALLSTPERRI